MVDELTLGDRIHELLDDSVFQEILKGAENECYDEWVAADTPEKREQIFAELKGAQRFLKRMRAAVDNAHLIRHRQKD
jgi:hypothetical protein